MSRSRKKISVGALVAKGGKPLVKVTSARLPKTSGELAVLWPTLAQVHADEAVRFERDLKAAKNNFSPMKDPTRETLVCAVVRKDQLRLFRAFLRRHGFTVHQSYRHPSGNWTYSFLAPFPQMDRRWHEVYRELYEAKISMIGDLD
jgi:hypothetical protein